jgi:hypothetical protein
LNAFILDIALPPDDLGPVDFRAFLRFASIRFTDKVFFMLQLSHNSQNTVIALWKVWKLFFCIPIQLPLPHFVLPGQRLGAESGTSR